MLYNVKLLAIALAVFAFIACGDTAEESAAAPEEDTPAVDENSIVVENAFHFMHVDGHGGESEMVAYVPFERELMSTVKYQVVYVMCTCRAPEVNYHSVAYVELSKEDGSIEHISYEQDAGNDYIAGLYGDSDVSWDGTPVRDLFDGFIEQTLMGASQDDINAIEPMHGEVDVYTGATVTPNNAVRMLQGLFAYHNRRYM
ncbi:MAG: hypothetical protein ACLFNQ_00335 [Spirochaetaceae bacterium]